MSYTVMLQLLFLFLHKTYVVVYVLGSVSFWCSHWAPWQLFACWIIFMLLLSSADFLKKKKKPFSKHSFRSPSECQTVWSKSGPTFCRSWFWPKLFAKVMRRRQVATSKVRVNCKQGPCQSKLKIGHISDFMILWDSGHSWSWFWPKLFAKVMRRRQVATSKERVNCKQGPCQSKLKIGHISDFMILWDSGHSWSWFGSKLFAKVMRRRQVATSKERVNCKQGPCQSKLKIGHISDFMILWDSGHSWSWFGSKLFAKVMRRRQVATSKERVNCKQGPCQSKLKIGHISDFMILWDSGHSWSWFGSKLFAKVISRQQVATSKQRVNCKQGPCQSKLKIGHISVWSYGPLGFWS